MKTGEFHGETTHRLENRFVWLEYLANAPRIVRFGPAGRPNLFADLEEAVETPYGSFYFRGGHRLWHAPEAMPRTYLPDNAGAVVDEIENGVRICQPVEPWTHIAKSLEIRLDAGRACVGLRHELRNEGAWTVELSPWALTMLRIGGVGIFPQPAGRVDATGLLPNRHITLWPYSHLEDQRLILRDDFILIRAVPSLPPVKMGYFNPHGWAGCWLDGVLFVKRFDEGGRQELYPDGGCNVECFCNDRFLELETLGPLTRLEPGASLFHTETWEIYAGLDALPIPADVRQIITGAPGE